MSYRQEIKDEANKLIEIAIENHLLLNVLKYPFQESFYRLKDVFESPC